VVAAGRGGVLDVVEDGRHGVLYDDGAADGGAAAAAAAIDKARRMGFNPLDLRQRAEGFGPSGFRNRIQSVLSAAAAPGVDRGSSGLSYPLAREDLR
jgi:glycosyltransferase involved in cell wall biosynthesis